VQLNSTVVMRLLFFLIPVIIVQDVSAAVNFPLGSRFSGMANCGVAMQDIWSVSHNQAGLAYLPGISASFHHENHFMIKEYGLSAAAIAIPTHPGTFAVHYSYFGYEKYHESKVAIAYAKAFGEKISCGIQLNYFSKFIQNEYGQGQALAVESGILCKPVKNLSIGFHVFNPNRSRFNEFSNERIPAIVRFGAGYYFSNVVLLCIETEKQSDAHPYYKAGMEYNPSKIFSIRVGISNNPLYLYSFGMGLTLKKARLDVASSFHQVLGFTPYISLSYTL
jgi:hypothetical protein